MTDTHQSTSLITASQDLAQTNSNAKYGPRFANYQKIAFGLTFILYCFSHAARTVWGYVKPEVIAESGGYYTKPMLGVLDTIFMASYAAGQYFNGWLGDRVNLRIFLLVGTLIATSALTLFAYLQGVGHLNNIYLTAVIFSANGLGQSTGYPGCVSIVSNWFDKAKNGLVFGLWGTSLNIGDVVGQQIGKFVLTGEQWGWQNAIFITCLFFIILAIILALFIKAHPKELSKKAVESEPLLGSIQSQGEGGHGHGQGISFMDAIKIKYVPQFAFSFFCIKGVIYGVIFWLPSYLEDQVKLEGDITYILASIEIGQILGSIIFGVLSDKLKSRAIAITSGFFFAVIFLIITYLIKSVQVKSIYFILLFLAGVGVGAPASLIGGAVASDIGQKLSQKSALSAISTVVGIMEGCGASGAALTQIFVSNFPNFVFPCFAFLCLVGGSMMAPIALRDYKRNQGSGETAEEEEE